MSNCSSFMRRAGAIPRLHSPLSRSSRRLSVCAGPAVASDDLAGAGSGRHFGLHWLAQKFLSLEPARVDVANWRGNFIIAEVIQGIVWAQLVFLIGDTWTRRATFALVMLLLVAAMNATIIALDPHCGLCRSCADDGGNRHLPVAVELHGSGEFPSPSLPASPSSIPPFWRRSFMRARSTP